MSYMVHFFQNMSMMKLSIFRCVLSACRSLSFTCHGTLSLGFEFSYVLALINWPGFSTDVIQTYFSCTQWISLSSSMTFSAFRTRIDTPLSFILQLQYLCLNLTILVVIFSNKIALNAYFTIVHYWLPKFVYTMTMKQQNHASILSNWMAAHLMNCGHQIETLFLLHRFTIPFVKMFWKNETNQHLFLRGHETNCNITKIAIMISVPNLLVCLFKFNQCFPLRHHCSAVPSSHLRCFFQEYLFKIIALFCLPDQNFPYEDSMLSLSLSRVFEFSILSMAILVIWAESYWRSFCEFLPGSLFSRFFLLPVMASTYFRLYRCTLLKGPSFIFRLTFLGFALDNFKSVLPC